MFPFLIFANGANCRLANSILFRKLHKCCHFSGIKSPNFLNIFFCQFSMMVKRSCRPILSILFSFINHIVFWSSKKQMTWPNARGVVAFVTNKKTIWNWSFMNLPRKSVRHAASAIYRQAAISSGKRSFGPNPAGFCLFDSKPKSFYGSFFVWQEVSI